MARPRPAGRVAAQRILGTLLEVAEGSKHGEGYGECINATRLVIESLRAFGVRSRPVSVGVTIGSPLFVDELLAGAIPSHLFGVTAGWFEEQDAPSRDLWDGHLTAYVPALDTLVDLVLPAVARSGGLTTASRAFVAGDGFWSGAVARHTTPEGLSVAYRHRPDALGWHDSRHWSGLGTELAPLTDALVKMMRSSR